MSQRSTVFTRLPLKVRQQLDQRLIAGGFGGYAQLTQWLNRKGYRISKSALNRYGVELEHRERELALASAGEQAAVFANLAEQDSVATVRGLLRLVQTETMMMLAHHEGNFNIDDLTRLTRAVIDLSRAAILQDSAGSDQLPPLPALRRSDPETDSGRDSVSEPTLEVIRNFLLGNTPPSAPKPPQD